MKNDVSAPGDLRPGRHYPYILPPPHWPAAKQATWRALKERRITLSMKGMTLGEIVAEMSRRCGIFFQIASGGDEAIDEYRVSDLSVYPALRLLLGPQGMHLRILDDGGIEILKGEFGQFAVDPEVEAIERVRGDLDQVKRRLQSGWNGLDRRLPPLGPLKNTEVTLEQGEYSNLRAIELIRERSDINILVDRDLPPELRKTLEEAQLQAVRDLTVEGHLRKIVDESGVAFVPMPEDYILVTSPSAAGVVRERLLSSRLEHTGTLEALDHAVNGPLPGNVPELVDRMERELGIPMLVSRDIWNASLPQAPGGQRTWRNLLEQYASKMRISWAIDEGKVFLVD